MCANGWRVVSSLVLCALSTQQFGNAGNRRHYYGRFIGSLYEYAHGIKGNAYAVDDTTIFIKGFCYDGTGPDAFFWVGNSSIPSPEGFLVPHAQEYKSREPPKLRAYNNTDVILNLPRATRIRDIRWLSVWCRRFTVDFGSVFIPMDLEVPKTRILPEFSRLAHGLRSGNISILNSKTFYIPNLHYDGGGADAYFWVGNSTDPNMLGRKVPNEVGSLEPLRGYQGEDIEIVLPGILSVYEIDWLAVWCVQCRQNFGHVLIPKDLDVPPVLEKTKLTTSSTPASLITKYELSSCKELLSGRVQVQWELVEEDVQIRISGRINEDQYVAFGLSGGQNKAEMLGGDVVVVGYDKKTGNFIADDYYITDFMQCDGKKGVCPDERVGGRNDALLLHGERKNGITTVTYMRPLKTNESVKDRIIPDSKTNVIAAIGPLNTKGEANAHESVDKTTEDVRIDFTSRNIHECTHFLYNTANGFDIESWTPAEIINENTFSARIGPTGGKRGQSRITGQPSQEIVWYINDLLIPEITVERGQTYTFIVEGGKNPLNPSKYHPLYITDSPEGGFAQKTETEQAQEKVFAGMEYGTDGYAYPTAAGRYCEWVHKTVDMSDNSRTFESFFETLRLECDEGEPAKLVWTVLDSTPDLVYYQCYRHNSIGWKIHVVNAGYRPQTNIKNTGEVPSIPRAIIPSFIVALKFIR